MRRVVALVGGAGILLVALPASDDGVLAHLVRGLHRVVAALAPDR